MSRRAITVERLLIWTIQTKQADKMVDGPTVGGDGGFNFSEAIGALTMTGIVSAMARLGCRVDQSSIAQRYYLHPDAERVFQACKTAFDPQTFGLVMACARSSLRPEWGKGIRPLEARPSKWVETAKGRRPALVVNGRGGGGRYAPITIADNRERIERMRENYGRWWRALDHLGMIFTGHDGLSDWAVSEVGAPREPWRGDVSDAWPARVGAADLASSDKSDPQEIP